MAGERRAKKRMERRVRMNLTVERTADGMMGKGSSWLADDLRFQYFESPGK